MTPPAGDLRRLRWSVPQADVSVNKWLDEQYDTSQSLRVLIRESIQREGYIDVANKPVEQLPRRGRPPLISTETDHADDELDDDEITVESVEDQHPADNAGAAPELHRSGAPEVPEQHSNQSASEFLSQESELPLVSDFTAEPESEIELPASSAAPAETPEAHEESQPKTTQLDMNDIFGHRR